MDEQTGDSSPQKQVSFEYIKSQLFRGIHADGIWGGVTPQGILSLTFYSERFPIPNQLIHKLKPDGTLGDEVESARISKTSIIREAEACVYMNLNVALAFRDLLNKQIEALEVLQKKEK